MTEIIQPKSRRGGARKGAGRKPAVAATEKSKTDIHKMNASFRSKRIPRFVEEYVKDRNGTQAAIRAGYSASSAHSTASDLLSDPKVREMVAIEMGRVTQEARVDAAQILREYLEIATADVSKIMHVRRVNCRYCWGEGHRYQWTEREYSDACDAANKGKHPGRIPDCTGGFGFRRNAEPNHECPECCGDGLEDIFFCDTDVIAGPERKLIAGIKRTKDGLEIKLRDQDGALKILAQYAGLLVERKELTGKDGRPLIPDVPPADLPDDPLKLSSLYSQIVGG